jgi:hypothetical protein
MTIAPSNEQVAVKWLQGIPALSGSVATKLPADMDSWVDLGFVTVAGAGGSPHMYLPIGRPVVSVHFWAASRYGGNPPWGKAANLYSTVRYGDYGVLDYANASRRLTGFPVAYCDVKVQNVNFLGEPERRPGDPGDFAEYICNLQIEWVPLQ